MANVDIDKIQGKKISRIKSKDFDYSIELIFDDNTKLVVYAHEWLGSPVLGYRVEEQKWVEAKDG